MVSSSRVFPALAPPAPPPIEVPAALAPTVEAAAAPPTLGPVLPVAAAGVEEFALVRAAAAP